MTPIGRREWIVGGCIPVRSTGPEPEFTSHDKLCVLNAGDRMASVRIFLQHADREPVGPYRITIAPRRVRHFRLNDLIDPMAMPLEVAYSAVIRADVPIVVQLTAQDSRQRELARAGALAYGDDPPRRD
jgi:hypothetical protein